MDPKDTQHTLKDGTPFTIRELMRMDDIVYDHWIELLDEDDGVRVNQAWQDHALAMVAVDDHT
jgi:hypothetical protein